MTTRKKALTIAERHAQEIQQLKEAHARETNDLYAKLAANGRETDSLVRNQRQAAGWQAAFFAGSISIILGIAIGAVTTFTATVGTLPIAYEQVSRLAMFQSAASAETTERAAEILEEKRGVEFNGSPR